jgi:pyruvate dehydrogenase E1 component
VAWEPAFTQDFEWTFLHALGALGREGGSSAYFRLSTRPLDQALGGVPAEGAEREQRRADVLAGGYRLRAGGGVTIVAVGAVVPEALAAADELDAEVVCLTSPDLVFRALQARAGLADADHAILDRLFPESRPLVTVVDGHPHTLAFLAGVHGAPIACLGVAQFGQSGDIADLYRHHGVDAETIVGAALDLG